MGRSNRGKGNNGPAYLGGRHASLGDQLNDQFQQELSVLHEQQHTPQEEPIKVPDEALIFESPAAVEPTLPKQAEQRVPQTPPAPQTAANSEVWDKKERRKTTGPPSTLTISSIDGKGPTTTVTSDPETDARLRKLAVEAKELEIEAKKAELRKAKPVYWGQIAGVALTIVTALGGLFAIYKGVRSATEADDPTAPKK